MFLLNVIHFLPLMRVAAYLRVPGLGFRGSSEGSVTLYCVTPLPMFPVILPAKPTEHRAS